MKQNSLIEFKVMTIKMLNDFSGIVEEQREVWLRVRKHKKELNRDKGHNNQNENNTLHSTVHGLAKSQTWLSDWTELCTVVGGNVNWQGTMEYRIRFFKTLKMNYHTIQKFHLWTFFSLKKQKYQLNKIYAFLCS